MNKEKLKQRAKKFAHRCVKPALNLPDNTLGKHICYQLIRAGTSVAANYRAACVAQTKASFVSKLNIMIEEVDESAFWIEFVVDEALMKRERVEPLLQEAEELSSIFIASRKTSQKR